MTKQERFIEIGDNIKLWVETYGNLRDEACIFISGAGANSSFWSDNLCRKLVNHGFFVIKYDHRDIGYSSKIDYEKHPYDAMQLAKDALTILDVLNVQKAHIIGHSMGGFIVQLLGIHYPEQILSMTSISASSNSPKMPSPPQETWEIFMENNPKNDFDNDIKDFILVWKHLNGTAEFDEKLAVEYTRNLYARQKIFGALGANHLKALANLTDRTELLKKVKIPTLIIHGEDDFLVDKYGGIQTAASIKNSQLVLIPKMGHMPFNIDILQQFENEIIQFIRKNSTYSRSFGIR